MPFPVAPRTLRKLAALPVVILWALFLVVGGNAGAEGRSVFATDSVPTNDLLAAQSASASLNAAFRSDGAQGTLRMGRPRDGGAKADGWKRSAGPGPFALAAAPERGALLYAATFCLEAVASSAAPNLVLSSCRTSRGPPASPRFNESET